MGANLIFFLWYGAKKSRVIDTDFNTLIWGHFRIYMFDMGSCFCPFIRYGVKKVQKCHFIRYGVFCFSLIWGRNHFVTWYGLIICDIGSTLLRQICIFLIWGQNIRYGVRLGQIASIWGQSCSNCFDMVSIFVIWGQSRLNCFNMGSIVVWQTEINTYTIDWRPYWPY